MIDKTTPKRWDYRSESRKDYGRARNSLESGVTFEEVNAGSLMRIADATELMARNHAELLAERDRYQRWYNEEVVRREQRDRTIRGLRGVITRMKRKHEGATDG
jgi:hypothetical protein